MATNFPGSLDAYVNPVGSDGLASGAGGVSHANMHANLHDAVEAIEAKVGANGSGVTSSHDYKIDQLESGLSTAESDIDTLETNVSTLQTDVGTLQTDVTALENKDFTVTFGSGSDLSGSFTVTNLGNVTNTTVAVRDDSHNHTISNVDGLQTALDAKLDATAKAADSDKLDNLNSSQFLRSDANDTMDGDLTIGTGHVIKFEGSTNDADELTLTCVDPTSDRTITFPNANGTVALTGHTHDYAPSIHTHSYLSTTSGGTVSGDTAFSSASSSASDTVALQVTGSNASIALRTNGSSSNSGSVVQVRSGRTGDNSRAMAYITQHDGTSMADINVNRVYYSGGSLGSSRTIKENIVSVHPAEGTSAYDTVKQIELSTFNYIGAETSDVQLGVIAEELIDVAPDFVEVHDGVPRWVKGSIHFLTLAALRQAISKIEALEARVAELGG